MPNSLHEYISASDWAVEKTTHFCGEITNAASEKVNK